MIAQERIRELFDLNQETGELFWKERGKGRRRSLLAGCLKKGNRTTSDRWVVYCDGRLWYRYHLVFILVNGYLPEEVDHEDHNTLNDRPDNLRPATPLLNMQNKRGCSKKGYPKGVFNITSNFHRNRPFTSRIRVDGKRISLGTFSTTEEAHEAYKRAALEHFGEFACFESKEAA